MTRSRPRPTRPTGWAHDRGRLARHGRAGRRPRSGRRRGWSPWPSPDPIRFLQGQLHELWKEAVNALQAQVRPGGPGAARPAGHKHIPVGPYRLVVVASIRGRAAGQIAIQGMANKQIEMTTPSFRTTGSANRPILAVWVYRDNSLVIAHLDFQGTETLRPLARPAVPPAQVRRPRRPPPRAREPWAWNPPTSSTPPSPAGSGRRNTG